MLLSVMAAALIGAAAPVNYRDDANWLCRPGREDVCAPDPVRTVVDLDGSMRSESIAAAAAPKADCFYVYPTASNDKTPNSDMIPGIEERGQAESQFAVFATVCRTFAPVYRQVTLTALHAAMANPPTSTKRGDLTQIKPDMNLGYEDVKAAWHDYLKNDNHGRPFVLLGHSQGSLVLKRLIADEIDGKPLSSQLLSAIIPGTNVLVLKGKDVGGDFKSLPLCRKDDQVGCIIAWMSYRDAAPPPKNALFGKSDNPAFEAACTNPARLEGGDAPLDAVIGFPWWINGVVQYKSPLNGWSVAGQSIPTRFARVPGMLSGKCLSSNGVTYLSVHVNPDAGDGLSGTMTAPAIVGDAAYPEWGWHVMDIPIVQANLVNLVGRQIHVWRISH